MIIVCPGPSACRRLALSEIPLVLVQVIAASYHEIRTNIAPAERPHVLRASIVTSALIRGGIHSGAHSQMNRSKYC